MSKNNTGIKNVQRHFRTFHDGQTTHHPQYVWGEKGKDFLTVGLTTKQKKGDIPIKNPETKKTNEVYIHPGVNKINKGIQNEKKKGWSFTNEDKKIVNKIIDDYKKKTK